MFYFFLFIFGLAIGSFINVIALRYRPDQKLDISGRSRCPVCHKQLIWYELIPVFSFLFQKGKCRHCGHKLFLQYPLVEILSGLIFVSVPLYFFKYFQFSTFNFQSTSQLFNYQLLITVIWLLIFLLFLLLSLIDFRQSIIPDEINLSLIILGIVLLIFNIQFNILNSFLGHYSIIFGFQENIWLNRLFAVLLGLFLFGGLIVFSRGKAMGWGDFKFIGALGLIFGWPDVIMVLALAFLVGGAASSILLIKSKKKMKDAVPFGPFLAIGASLTFFFGYWIISWYFKLCGV